MTAGAGVLVTVIGEALIDLIPGQAPRSFTASPAGSPFNVAIGLARLGQSTALMARMSDNAFGRMLRSRADDEGIYLGAAPRSSEPTTMAVVSLDAAAQPSYDFYIDGTADWLWTAAEIGQVPPATEVLHFGSLASWTPPGDERILALARSMRDRGAALVSYDPNIRPRLLGDADCGRRMVEGGVRLAHLVKASAEDIGWLYPGWSAAAVAGHWLGLGPAVVVITDSARGADAFTAAGPPVHRPAREVTVVDTTGAGDSFTSGLLSSLIGQGLHSPAELARRSAPDLTLALDDAILAAALTCQRSGAEPPTTAEVEAARQLRGCLSSARIGATRGAVLVTSRIQLSRIATQLPIRGPSGARDILVGYR